MHTESYDETKKASWDRFVFTHPLAGMGHLSAQFRLAEVTGTAINRSVMLYEDAQLIGVLPLFEATAMVSRFFKTRTLSTHGAAGPLLEGALGSAQVREAQALLIQTMKQMAAASGADRIQVSYPSVVDAKLASERFGIYPLRSHGFREINTVGGYIDLRSDENSLMNHLDSSCRNKVRRAAKEGAELQIVRDRSLWLACEQLNIDTLGSLCLSRRAMEVIWEEFVANDLAFVIAVTHGSEVVSIVVASVFNRVAYYWYSFNKRPAAVTGSNNAALWRAILHSRELGATHFLLGSYHFEGEADSKHRSIAAFKRSFGGSPYYVMDGELILRPCKHLVLQLTTELKSAVRSWVRNDKPSGSEH